MVEKIKYCANCGTQIGLDVGPSDGWQLEDGRTVCHSCDLKNTHNIIDLITSSKFEYKNGQIYLVIKNNNDIKEVSDIDSLIELYEKKIAQKELSIIMFNNLNDKTGKMKANYAIALYEEFIDNLRKIERWN